MDHPVDARPGIVKAPSGIVGLDEIMDGGLPRGRPTLLCGSAGCGKTLMALEFLVRGAIDHGEPGVFVAFEERTEELAANVRSLGFDLDELVRSKLLVLDHVHLERSEIEETGEYDLEGLFVRLGFAIDEIGARRIAIDTLETLFSGLSNAQILRAELRRLFRWLKDREMTAVITAERGDGALTRHGMEEYVSDCVILLDHRVHEQVSTRRLRVVKYRGSHHGTNEYPFVIDEGGISVLPISSLGLDHDAPEERISTGIPDLDLMLDGQGVYRASSVLISGTSGIGKTTVAAHMAAAACARGERVLYYAFEESPAQLTRNLRSVGLDVAPFVRDGLWQFHAERPTFAGLEMHLSTMLRQVDRFEPGLVVLDPVTNLVSTGAQRDVEALLLRLLDFLKARSVTSVYTSLTSSGRPLEATDSGLSSLIDTWLLLRDIEIGGERNRALYVLKSRGMPHSNQIREFRLTSRGIHLEPVYVGPEGVLTGSMRVAQEARERAEATRRAAEAEQRERQLGHTRRSIEAQIEALRADLAAHEDESASWNTEQAQRSTAAGTDRTAMRTSRGAPTNGLPPPGGSR